MHNSLPRHLFRDVERQCCTLVYSLLILLDVILLRLTHDRVPGQSNTAGTANKTVTMSSLPSWKLLWSSFGLVPHQRHPMDSQL